ncbi:MAG: hypothetical protein ACI835_000267, partial [Planctomycetota bacterium]
ADTNTIRKFLVVNHSRIVVPIHAKARSFWQKLRAFVADSERCVPGAVDSVLGLAVDTFELVQNDSPRRASVDDHREDFAHDPLLVDQVGRRTVEGLGLLSTEVRQNRKLAFEALRHRREALQIFVFLRDRNSDRVQCFEFRIQSLQLTELLGAVGSPVGAIRTYDQILLSDPLAEVDLDAIHPRQRQSLHLLTNLQ